MYMYTEIHRLIDNELKNYDKRPLTQRTITKEDLTHIHTYTRMWANDEARNDLALYMASQLDKKLYEHVQNVTDMYVEVHIPGTFIDLLRELENLDETLQYEEAENLGLTRSAHNLRKQWRKKLRKAHKLLNRYHKKPSQLGKRAQ